MVYALAYWRGIGGYRLVLVGVGIGEVAVSITSWLPVVAHVYDAAPATGWLTGSLDGRGREHVVPVGLALSVLVPAALLLTFALDALRFGRRQRTRARSSSPRPSTARWSPCAPT